MTGSQSLLLAGVLSAAVGLTTLVYPPAVEPTVWTYPFPPSVHVVVAVVLVACHGLKAYGFVVGLSRLGGPLVRGSMWVAAVGFVVVAACEGLSATMSGVAVDDPAAVQLDNGYGAGSMLFALSSIVGGAVIARDRLLPGPGRWSVLLSGAFMLFVVTPALIAGRGPLAYLALLVWSLFYVWVGLALRQTEQQAGG